MDVRKLLKYKYDYLKFCKDEMMLTLYLVRNKQFESLDDDEEEEVKRPGREHYDAYPTKDGLSRPYGAFPVFQPAKPSANLRHYRTETERPIQL